MNPIHYYAQRRADQESIWIDETFKRNIPPWKWFFIEKWPSPFMAKVLGLDIEIRRYRNLDTFAEVVEVFINSKVVGKARFYYEHIGIH